MNQNDYINGFDFMVIGCGASGLLTALKLADAGRVLIVNKDEPPESNTYFAQGGIAGVMDSADTYESHINDTIQAGAGLCHKEVVQAVITRSSEIIRELMALGTEFDTESGHLHLTREGGHSKRRIAHVQDATGRAIGETLLAQVLRHPNINWLHQSMAVDLITARHLGRYSSGPDRCLGAYILDGEGRILSIPASYTILAAGGAGKVYLYTSNPHGATGDGIAMAWRAGCPVMNLEFMQFHPTCLFHPSAPTMLLTESLRGEGAYLIDTGGRRFMFDYDERGELAPRDIVARAIDHELKKSGADNMFLDARKLGAEKIGAHFPNISRRLLALGIDMQTSPIPVVPAAHYMCGGVKAELSGRTELERFFVIGEAACTGLHGANRLASNSLLECLVMAESCAKTILKKNERDMYLNLPAWDASGTKPESERVQIKQNWDEIRTTMVNYVGIVRSDERLRRAKRRLGLIRKEIASYYWQHPIDRDLVELRNLSLVAELIVRSAQSRRESRGLHYSIDYPDMLPNAKDTVLKPEPL